ncbi:MAG: hypothetical protein LBQ24_04525 [Candidatus Peribacteria bacterium]|nr:hypothetical protein [Candidatus Peribacteria bacterium]
MLFSSVIFSYFSGFVSLNIFIFSLDLYISSCVSISSIGSIARTSFVFTSSIYWSNGEK